jgi:predicted SAM-dependent methyltransferase
MGIPVVSLTGEAPVSRLSASALAQAGLADLAAPDAQVCTAKAVALANDTAARERLRRELRTRLRASPLLDMAAFVGNLESAYFAMWRNYMETGREALRLHIGGQQKMPGWKILNAQPGPDVDYVGDCSDLSQFADESVEEIYASHVLEHLGYVEQLPRTLAEFHRVLKPRGTVKISVPDFEVLCRLFLDPKHGPAERFHILRMVFGGQTDEHDFHRVGLTFELLSQFLSGARFTNIQRVGDFGLFDDTSSLRFSGVPISLNLTAAK